MKTKLKKLLSFSFLFNIFEITIDLVIRKNKKNKRINFIVVVNYAISIAIVIHKSVIWLPKAKL